ncbi:MAG: fatty acid CoA ligase family protein [Elusimicrobiota bacterium]|nr:MAG: fatty acid CoA ligase family protein [Elusimicrobiota bacterium]
MTATQAADIGSRLLDNAKRLGKQPALIQRDKVTTYEELGKDVELLAQGFLRAGLQRNQRAAVLIPPSRDFFSTAFALFRSGVTPVLIDPGIGFSNLGRCLGEAEPDAFVGSAKAHIARAGAGWAPSARLKIVAGGPSLGLPTLETMREIGAGRTLPLPELSPETRAAILFTSGSTGAPKGAVYEHSMFSAQVDQLRSLFDIKEGEVSLATFPLFAIFDLALGQTVILPDMDFTRPGMVDPMAIVEPVQKHAVTQLFGSPALIDRVGRFGARHGIALPSLRRVMSAGAPVPAKVMETFAKMLSPETPIYTPYGATEALPVALTNSNEILRETAKETAKGKGICVGRPVPGIKAEVIRIEDGPIKTWSDELKLPVGQVGEIVVQGPVVTGEYFRRVDDMAKAKIGDGKTFWHRMGDLGYFDDQGRLWFCGRKAHRVRTEKGTLYTICVEQAYNVHPAVKRTALVGAGMIPVLCVELEPGNIPSESLKAELLSLPNACAEVKDLLFHPAFPVDTRHNAKINREALAVWAAKELGA